MWVLGLAAVFCGAGGRGVAMAEYVKATVYRCTRGFLMNLKRGAGETKSYSFSDGEKYTLLALLDQALGEPVGVGGDKEDVDGSSENV